MKTQPFGISEQLAKLLAASLAGAKIGALLASILGIGGCLASPLPPTPGPVPPAPSPAPIQPDSQIAAIVDQVLDEIAADRQRDNEPSRGGASQDAAGRLRLPEGVDPDDNGTTPLPPVSRQRPVVVAYLGPNCPPCAAFEKWLRSEAGRSYRLQFEIRTELPDWVVPLGVPTFVFRNPRGQFLRTTGWAGIEVFERVYIASGGATE